MTTIGLLAGTVSTPSSAAKTGDPQSAEGFGTAMHGVLGALAQVGTAANTAAQSGSPSAPADIGLVERAHTPTPGGTSVPTDAATAEHAGTETPVPGLAPVATAPVAISATTVQGATSPASREAPAGAGMPVPAVARPGAAAPVGGVTRSVAEGSAKQVTSQATVLIIGAPDGSASPAPQPATSTAVATPTTAPVTDSGIRAGASLPTPATPATSTPASPTRPVTQVAQPAADSPLAHATPSAPFVEPPANAHSSAAPTELGELVVTSALRGEQAVARASVLPAMAMSTQATPLSANASVPSDGVALLPVPTEEPARPGPTQLPVLQPVSVPPMAPAAQAVTGLVVPSSPSAVPLTAQLTRPLFTLAAAGPGEHVMTVKVTPDNLGPVTVRAHVGSDGVRIELFAPSDLGRDAIRAILPDLRRDLAGSGLGSNLDLSPEDHPTDPGDNAPGGERRAPDARTLPDREPGDLEAQQTPRARQYGSSSTIDVMA